MFGRSEVRGLCSSAPRTPAVILAGEWGPGSTVATSCVDTCTGLCCMHVGGGSGQMVLSVPMKKVLRQRARKRYG